MSVIIISRLRRFRGAKLWHMSRRNRLFIDCAAMITILGTMAIVTNVPSRVEKADAAVFQRVLLTYRQPSHAVTEVLTSRGWMMVDSNHPWIALTKNNVPVPADQVWRRTAEFASLSEGMDEPAWVIRALYSRKGLFFKPTLPRSKLA